MDYLSCPNKYQATPRGSDCGISFGSFRYGHIPAVTVRCDRTTKTKRQTRYRCLWGTPWGTLFTANAFPLYIVFCMLLVFCGFSQNHPNFSNPDQDQKTKKYEKGLHIRKSLSMSIFGFITFDQSTSNREMKSPETAI